MRDKAHPGQPESDHRGRILGRRRGRDPLPAVPPVSDQRGQPVLSTHPSTQPPDSTPPTGQCTHQARAEPQDPRNTPKHPRPPADQPHPLRQALPANRQRQAPAPTCRPPAPATSRPPRRTPPPAVQARATYPPHRHAQHHQGARHPPINPPQPPPPPPLIAHPRGRPASRSQRPSRDHQKPVLRNGLPPAFAR